MASVTYGKCNLWQLLLMASVIMAKILWQMKLSLGDIDIKNLSWSSIRTSFSNFLNWIKNIQLDLRSFPSHGFEKKTSAQ